MHTGWSSLLMGSASRVGSRIPRSKKELAVHSVYPSTINLQGRKGELYAIITKDRSNHPCSILLDDPLWVHVLAKKRLDIGSTATIHEQGLFFNCGLWVSFLGAKRVHPNEEGAVRVSSIATDTLLARLRLLQTMQKRRNTVLQIPQQDGNDSTNDYFNRQFHHHLDNLTTNIMANDGVASLDSIRSLIGFGPGSTPSGDDFLCGLFLSWHMVEHDASKSPLLWRIMEKTKSLLIEQRHLTTDISRMFLLLACDGLFSDSLLALARSWADTESENRSYIDALTTLSEIGHSSGLDAAYGMVYGCSIMASLLQKRRVHDSSILLCGAKGSQRAVIASGFR